MVVHKCKTNTMVKKRVKHIKNMIFVRQLRAEMTQCRVIQVDKKIKGEKV